MSSDDSLADSAPGAGAVARNSEHNEPGCIVYGLVGALSVVCWLVGSYACLPWDASLGHQGVMFFVYQMTVVPFVAVAAVVTLGCYCRRHGHGKREYALACGCVITVPA